MYANIRRARALLAIVIVATLNVVLTPASAWAQGCSYTVTPEDLNNLEGLTRSLGLYGNYEFARVNGPTWTWYAGKVLSIPCGGSSSEPSAPPSVGSMWSTPVPPPPTQQPSPTQAVSLEAVAVPLAIPAAGSLPSLAPEAVKAALSRAGIYGLIAAVVGAGAYASHTGDLGYLECATQQSRMRFWWNSADLEKKVEELCGFLRDGSLKPKPTPQPPRIAVIEDNPRWQALLSRTLPANLGGTVDVYPTCEKLLAQLSVNPGLNYNLYILDNNLGSGMTGPQCIPAIQKLRPGARVFGVPGDDSSRDDFARVGAEILTKDTLDLGLLIEKLTNLLK